MKLYGIIKTTRPKLTTNHLVTKRYIDDNLTSVLMFYTKKDAKQYLKLLDIDYCKIVTFESNNT